MEHTALLSSLCSFIGDVGQGETEVEDTTRQLKENEKFLRGAM
jgi:hypothetical protein